MLDRADPLAHARRRFVLPKGLVYLDGNSLGALPASAEEKLRSVISEEWGDGLIRSWNEAGWFELPLTLGDRLGHLLGAAAGQVAVCDSTTINLYKALTVALALRAERSVLVMDRDEFPTNLYIAESVAATAERLIERRLVDPETEPDRIVDDDVAVLALSHVNYRTAALRDLAAISARAHEVGALVVWDLCHSAGVVPIALDDAEVDFAVGCSYKFLNGGPGAPAWIYVARRHLEDAEQPLTGWMGHAAPFDFDGDYRPDPGIRRFLCGTPPILSMQAVALGLDSFAGVDIAAVREKAIALTELFIERVAGAPAGRGLRLISPRDAARRGAQVSFEHEHGYALIQALIARGIIGDYREPGVMRFGFAPLYLSFAEVARAADELVACVEDEVWRQPRFASRSVVT